MIGAIALLQALARLLIIATIAAATAMIQVAHDYDEVGHIRPTGLIVFTIWAVLGGFVAACGKIFPTGCFIVLSAMATLFVLSGRADVFAVAMIGALVLHIAAPIFFGRPVIWDGWTTLLVVITIIGVVASRGSSSTLKVQADPVAISGSRPMYGIFRTVTAFSACLSVASVVALIILVA